jgi:hypothetical protein
VPPGFHRALLYHPTGLVFFAQEPFLGQKKEYLSLDMRVDISPALLKTLYGLERNT